MPSQRSKSATILIAVVAGLLAAAVLVAELPELLTLNDCTANDFAVRKVSTSQTTTKLSVTRYDSVQPNANSLKQSRRAGWTTILEGVKPTSSSLFILLRTLRT